MHLIKILDTIKRKPKTIKTQSEILPYQTLLHREVLRNLERNEENLEKILHYCTPLSSTAIIAAFK